MKLHILPCLCCGGAAHEGGYRKCPHYGFRNKPITWDSEIESLGDFPVGSRAGLGQKLRLRMLRDWSRLPEQNRRLHSIPPDPKDFDKIDVGALSNGEVVSWCAIFDITVRDAKKARRKLKNKFSKYATGMIDVRTTNLAISHPYRCSKYPNDDRMAGMHVAHLRVDWDNPFALFNNPCPYPGCNGVIEHDITG